MPPHATLGAVLLGRTNALEFDGRIARRFAVFTYVNRGGVIESAELSREPAEVRLLPMKPTEATLWAVTHFEDLDPERMRALVDRLTRPAGELAGRPTDPLA